MSGRRGRVAGGWAGAAVGQVLEWQRRNVQKPSRAGDLASLHVPACHPSAVAPVPRAKQFHQDTRKAFPKGGRAHLFWPPLLLPLWASGRVSNTVSGTW